MVLKRLARLLPLYKYQISGNSMTPALKNGQTIIVNRLSYLFNDPKKEDIIALKDPRDGKILIKRITKIAGREIFVQGDNKKASTDSRVFGMIDHNDIIGKVIF